MLNAGAVGSTGAAAAVPLVVLPRNCRLVGLTGAAAAAGKKSIGVSGPTGGMTTGGATGGVTAGGVTAGGVGKNSPKLNGPRTGNGARRTLENRSLPTAVGGPLGSPSCSVPSR